MGSEDLQILALGHSSLTGKMVMLLIVVPAAKCAEE